MTTDLGDVRAAGLEGRSGANQAENWVRYGSGLEDLTLGAPSALQTQRDSPFWQKNGSVCEGLSMT